MHVFAMRNYPAVEKFLKLTPKAVSKVQDAKLPDVNMSAFKNASTSSDRWARLDAIDTSRLPEATTEMPLPIFNAFLDLFKG